jgi:hypothetical protein
MIAMQVLAIFTTALGKRRARDLLHVPFGHSVVVTGRPSHIMASHKTGGKSPLIQNGDVKCPEPPITRPIRCLSACEDFAAPLLGISQHYRRTTRLSEHVRENEDRGEIAPVFLS